MDIRVRQDADIARCLDLARAVHAGDGYPPRGPIDVATFLAPRDQIVAWVAESSSLIVGHAALHRSSAAVTVAAATRHLGCAADDVAVVARVFVGASARREGVARALLDQGVTGAHELGLHPILDVATHLEAAIALYERAGWERVDTVRIEFPTQPDLECHVYVGPPPPTAPAASRWARAKAVAPESSSEN